MKNERLKEYVSVVSYKEFHATMAKHILGQPNLEKISLAIYLYLKNLAEDKPFKNNIILAAPSGCGKTEVYRTLKKIIPENVLPIILYDTTNLTEAGFNGDDSNDLMNALFSRYDCDGSAIMFLDELDKKIIPSFDAHGDNVNAAALHQLLTLLEGREVQKNNHKIDTSRTLFVGMGSFESFRKAEQEKKQLGFLASVYESYDYYQPIELEDMLKAGAFYEFLGRFPVIVSFGRLEPATIKMIIEKYRRTIESNITAKIQITENAITELISIANSEFGCRTLYNKILNTILSVYGKLLLTGQHGTIVMDSANSAFIKQLED